MIWLAGLPVIWWAAILLADAIQPGRNLFELMKVLTEKLNHPFQFHYTEYTIKSMLVCTLLYAAGIGIFIPVRRTTAEGKNMALPDGAVPGRSVRNIARSRTPRTSC